MKALFISNCPPSAAQSTVEHQFTAASTQRNTVMPLQCEQHAWQQCKHMLSGEPTLQCLETPAKAAATSPLLPDCFTPLAIKTGFDIQTPGVQYRCFHAGSLCSLRHTKVCCLASVCQSRTERFLIAPSHIYQPIWTLAIT